MEVPMNLNDMRALVRCDLHDEDEDSERWTDDELDRAISRAVAELSEHLPLESAADLTTTAGSRELDLGSLSGRVMVAAVEYPAGEFPRRFQPFSLWGDTLTLLGEEVPDGSDATVYYGTLHTLDAQGGTLPALHEDLVALGAAGYAAVEQSVYAVNRVNAGGASVPADLRKWGKDRLDRFRAELRRLGRRNRVRATRLYVPDAPASSQTTDVGP
jgi:hypothetical protein